MAHRMGLASLAVVSLVMMLLLTGCANDVAAIPAPTFTPPALVANTPATTPAPRQASSAPAQNQSKLQPVAGRVVLDPGHGGRDNGAEAGGIIEKNLTLQVSLAVAEELRQRCVTVIMTRNNDRFVELADRAQAANDYRANLFLAIHADVNPSSTKVGHSILLPQSGNPLATQAARWIDYEMTRNSSPSHIIRQDDRGLYVLRHVAGPAILLEMGFLSNPYEAGQLRNSTYRQRLAHGIALGVIDYLQRNGPPASAAASSLSRR